MFATYGISKCRSLHPMLSATSGGSDLRQRRQPVNSRPADLRRSAWPLGEVTALVLATWAEQRAYAFNAKAVELVDGTQDSETLAESSRSATPMASSTPSRTLRLLTLTTYWPRGTPSASSVSAASMHSSASAATDEAPTVSASNWVNWRIAPRPRLLVPPYRARLIAAEGLGQALIILRHVAGERRRQIVAERQPLLVVVLEGEHALVRPVLVGQELAERVGIFDGRRVERLEAVGLEHAPDGAEHLLGGADLACGNVE